MLIEPGKMCLGTSPHLFPSPDSVFSLSSLQQMGISIVATK